MKRRLAFAYGAMVAVTIASFLLIRSYGQRLTAPVPSFEAVGLDLGVISPDLFTMMILMAIVTKVATTPVLRRIVPAPAC